ncbi:Acb2/Tad1 domain-containing protein [Chroococcidiopsis sp.]|uniref:Acb2/Tad1 domain-containing protein n=1 Tax=Chroococcidiopsis sp. TaxID=3088168 RepID=UPI003F324DF4
MDLPIEEYFRYHPPGTAERKRKHDLINQLSMEFAKALSLEIVDEDCKKMALFALQQCRMFANQGITVDELKQFRTQK